MRKLFILAFLLCVLGTTAQAQIAYRVRTATSLPATCRSASPVDIVILRSGSSNDLYIGDGASGSCAWKGPFLVTAGASNLDALTDVIISAPAAGMSLRYNGTNWVNSAILAADIPAAVDAAKLADGSVSNAEFQRLDGLTSAAQTQIDAKQSLDSDLTAIAALSPSDNDTLMRIAGAWTNRTVAQAKTIFGLENVDNTSDATKNAASATLTNKTFVAPILGIASATSVATTGTAGAGFLELPTQSSPPAAPASGYREYADSTGRKAWIRASDGFTRTWDATLTADRVYALPDASDTLVGQATSDNLSNKTITSSTNRVKADLIATAADLTSLDVAGELIQRTTDNTVHGFGSAGGFQYWNSGVNTSLAEINSSCVDAGANDTYTCTLNPAITAYAVGSKLRFFANTINTGATSINFNGLGALAIKVLQGTADPANGDIKAGAWVEGVVKAGSIFEMTSASGNAAAGGGVALGDSPDWTEDHTFTKNGVVSLPTIAVTGTPFTGGSATTTKPLVLIETAGATSANWSTSGTMFGVNAPSGFTGNIIDAQLNGAARFSVSSTGAVVSAQGYQASATANFVHLARSRFGAAANGQLSLSNSAATGLQALVLGATTPSTIGTAPAQGQTLTILQSMELLTIAASPTTVTAMQIPAGAVVMAVSVRVTTVIPTAATFSVKVGATTVSTTAVSTAATTTDVGTAAASFYNSTAQGVTITPDLTPGAATGVVRITVMYYLVTPPTS